MEPSRPTVRCYPVAAARGSFATLDGPQKQEHESITRRTKSHRATSRIGVIWITAVSASRERALSISGARQTSASADGLTDSPRIAARRRQSHVPHRASRSSEHGGMRIETHVAPSHGGAAIGSIATGWRTSTGGVFQYDAPLLVRSGWAHRPAGLTSRGVASATGMS